MKSKIKPSTIKKFNTATKSKKLLKAGVFAVFATMPTLSASVEVENVNINNKKEVTAFAEQEARTFLTSYKIKPPKSLQKYIMGRPNNKLAINFIAVEESIKYDMTSKSLVNISKDNTYKNFTILGKTSKRIYNKFNYKIDSRTTDKAMFFRISKFNISNTLKQNVIIASELQDYSCYSKHMEKHERQHVMFNKATYKAYSSITEKFYIAALKPIAKLKIPIDDVSSKTLENTIEEMRRYVNKVKRDINIARLKTSKKLHARIDSKTSYRNMAQKAKTQCGRSSELSRKIRKSLNR